jgi:malonate-semialdehyde dehydrogenase (acetylating)/methylmalonate-semialdehyde dehydrogenase
MRHIEHFIVGGTGGGAGGRVGDVFDPNSGTVQAKVPLGGQAEHDLSCSAAQ